MTLTRHLSRQLIAWSIACAMAMTLLALYRSERDSRQASEQLARSAARVLDMQWTRIAMGAEHAAQFPDWGLLEGLHVPAGTCLRLRGSDGKVWRSDCTGFDLARAAPPPRWFGRLHAWLAPAPQRISRRLQARGTAASSIEVETDPRELTARAWHTARATWWPALGIAGALAALSLWVVTRALRPARALLDRIDALEGGAPAPVHAGYRFAELQRIGDALERLAESLAEALGRQRRLAAELIRAQEDERRRLARELHDEFGQALAGIAALTGAVTNDVDACRMPPPTELARISDATAAMQRQLRELLERLGPASLDELGLGAALRSLAREWHARCRGRPAFVCEIAPDVPTTLPPALAITAYRIAQEALTNAARHAQAHTVHVAVTLASVPCAALIVTVQDDGEHGAAALTPGRGLSGMRERAIALGGAVEWGATGERGFGVRAVLPLMEAAA